MIDVEDIKKAWNSIDFKGYYETACTSFSKWISNGRSRINAWEMPHPIATLNSHFGTKEEVEETPQKPLEEKVAEPEYTPQQQLDNMVKVLQDKGVITPKHREAYAEVGYLVMALAYRNSDFEIGPLEELAVSYVAPSFTIASAGGKGGTGKSLILQSLLFGLNNNGLSSILLDLDPEDNGKGFLRNVVERGHEENAISRYVRKAWGKVVFENGAYEEWIPEALSSTGLNIFDFKREIIGRENIYICTGSTSHADIRMHAPESQYVLSQLFRFFSSQVPTDIMGVDLPGGASPSTIERWNSADLKFLVMDMTNEGAWEDATKFLKVAAREYINSKVEQSEQIIDGVIKRPKIGRKPNGSETNAYDEYQALSSGKEVGSDAVERFKKLIRYGNALADRIDYDSLSAQRWGLQKEDIPELRELLDRTIDDPKYVPGSIHISQIKENTDNERIKTFLRYTLYDLGNSIYVVANKVVLGREEGAMGLIEDLRKVTRGEFGFDIQDRGCVEYATALFKYLSDRKQPFFYAIDDKELKRIPVGKDIKRSLTRMTDRVDLIFDRHTQNTVKIYAGIAKNINN